MDPLLGDITAQLTTMMATTCTHVESFSMYGSPVTLLGPDDLVRLSSYVDYSPMSFDKSSDTCSICMDIMNYSMTMDCGHSFHYNCAVRWLRDSHTCPLCRGNKSVRLPGIVSPL